MISHLRKKFKTDQGSKKEAKPDDIIKASIDGDLDNIQQLLSQGITINFANDENQTPLYCASLHNHVETVKFLLQNKAFVDVKEQVNGRTALLAAARNGHFDVAQELITFNAEVNSHDKHGWSALLLACHTGDKQIVELLLPHGANVNDNLNADKNTPLIVAARLGHTDIARILVAAGASLEQSDKNGSTPLLHACTEGHYPITMTLIEAGVDIRHANDNGVTPFLISCQNGYTDIARVLIQKGAKINTPSGIGATPLMVASGKNHLEVVKLLVNCGAEIDTKSSSGNTALHLAALEDNPQIVQYLLEKGAALVPNNASETALDIAKRKGHLEIVSTIEGHKQQMQEKYCLAEGASSGVEKDRKNLDHCKAGTILKVSENFKILEKGLEEGMVSTDLDLHYAGVRYENPVESKPYTDFDDQHLLSVAEKLVQGPNWKLLGGYLRLEHSNITKLANEYADDIRFAAWSMLVSWRNQTSGNVDEKKQILRDAAIKANRQDLWDVI